MWRTPEPLGASVQAALVYQKAGELQKKFPAFRPGRDKWEALCTVCKAGTYVSLSSGGARDLKFHLDTEKHKKAVRGESSASSISMYFVRPGNEDAVNAAEATWSFHTVKHHHSYLIYFF